MSLTHIRPRVCTSLGILLLCTACWAQNGYRHTSQSIEIDRASHWRAWSAPAGLVTITDNGAVQPRKLATSINASLTAGDFRYELAGSLSNFYDNSVNESGVLLATGGIKRAYTNAAVARRMMDGDDETFWEPNADDELASWQVEVDLGRLVSATSIVVRFVDDSPEVRADPFYQFRVHTATGQNPFDDASSSALDYQLAGGTTEPNLDQREFSFDLEPALEHSDGWTGRLVQYVRLAVTGRRGTHGEELTQSEYEALGAADQGDVENLWLIAGEQRLVTQASYDALPVDQQGGHRYFRRERPRLAEVEVWTAGDNVATRIVERGGSLQEGNPNSAAELAFDGSIRSNWNATVFSTVGDIAGWGLLQIDLGALLRIDAVRTITRRAALAERVLYGYQLRGSDGSVAPDGSLIWETLSSKDRLFNQSTRLFEDRFDARLFRFLEFRNLDTARRTLAHEGNRFQSVVTEMQIYSSGTVPEVNMVSDLIDMNTPRILQNISWDAETPEGTSVEIRTRTGDELNEISHYYLKTGEEVTKSEWDSKPSFFRDPLPRIETVPGPGWSNFSQAYIDQGERIVSPSPRRYLIVEARLLTSSVDTAATLRSISVSTLQPVATQLLAEISPNREVPVGELIDFDVYLRPSFVTTRSGNFNHLRLTAPSRSVMTLRGVDLGDEDDFSAATIQGFTRAGDSLFQDDSGQTLSVTGDGTDTLLVQLPASIRSTGPDLVRLSFTATVFQSGSTFGLEAAAASTPDSWQSADGGDAVGDDLSIGSGLTVMTPLGGSTVRIGDATSRVFSPNGDGINDQGLFEFAVLRINVHREVGVHIYDLTGRQIRTLAETRSNASGLYRIEWDGLDAKDQLVPPGIYIVRYKVDADAGGATPTGLISVAY